MLVAALTGGACTAATARGRYVVPSSIVADCSRPVDGEINTFLATVPDGATVRFPPGRCYGQDRTIVLRDRRRLTIDGGGSTFQRITAPNTYDPPTPNTGNANWRVTRGDRLTLRNLTVRGNYRAPARGTAARQGQHTDQGISLWGASNVTIRDVSVFDTDGEFVEADPDVETAQARYGGDLSKAAPSSEIRVINLHGEHAARQCVATTAVDGFWMEQSSIGDCQQNGFDAEIDAEGEPNRNLHLIGNTFAGTYFSAISIPVLSLPGHEGEVGNIEIRENKVIEPGDTCYPAVLVGADQRGGAEATIITGNTLLTRGDGIVFGGAPGAVRASVTQNDIRKTVQNTGCDNPGFDPPHATPVRTNNNPVSISGNRISGFCCGQDAEP